MPKKVHTYRYANGRFKHFVVWQFESWLDGPQDLPRLGMSKIRAILVRFPAFLSSSFISPFSLSSLFTFTRPRANGMKRMKMGKIHFIDILETTTKQYDTNTKHTGTTPPNTNITISKQTNTNRAAYLTDDNDSNETNTTVSVTRLRDSEHSRCKCRNI